MFTRRDFLVTIMRSTSFAIIAAGSGYLFFRKTSVDECNFDFVCKNCKNLKECSLPEAKEHKNK